LGEKANLAVDYLSQNYGITGVERPDAMNKLMEVSGLSAQDATNLLWDTYDPYALWYRFAIIGILSAIGMLFYAHWVKKYEAPDV